MDSNLDSCRKKAKCVEWMYVLLLGVLPGAAFLESKMTQLSQIKVNPTYISEECLTQAH